MKFLTKRRGFTLYETMLIILVMGILATMLIYSSTEAVATAKAITIINNLQKIRDAALAWYSDHRDVYKELNRNTKKIQFETSTVLPEIVKYMDAEDRDFELNKGTAQGANDKLQDGGYGIFNVYGYRTTWYVGYQFSKDEERVKEKVMARAASAGLIFAQKWPDPRRSDWNKLARVKDLTGYETVWMYILGDFSETGWWQQKEVDEIHKHEASGDKTK